MHLKNISAMAARRWCAGVVVAWACAHGAVAADPAARVIQDPHYGDTLFQFFQDRYFTAVTQLMVSQHFNRVAMHADEAEVLRGGMLLSYGMHREAGEIFSALIERQAPPAVRSRAWFYLAKIRYQRGLMAEAAEALARIDTALPADLEEEHVLLSANVLMAQGEFARAADMLSALATARKDDPRAPVGARHYARYNLGVAWVRSGEAERGMAVLDVLGRSLSPPNASEEFRSLRDRTNVALGYAALQAEQPQSASAYLERVRLSGMQSNKALLGFGWAAALQDDHQFALVPWTELSQRNASDAAVLEAAIALPYAFGELGAYDQALEKYNAALALYAQENQALDESVAAIRAGALVDGLLAHNPGEEMGWFWNIESLPRMPHAGHLTQVLARHDFQEAFKNYRDLQFLARNIDHWLANLEVYGDILDSRRAAYNERLPHVLAQSKDIGTAAQAERAAQLAQQLQQAQEQADGHAFANDAERDLMARLDRVQQFLRQAGPQPELAAARARARLAAGALTWRLAQAHPERLWEARKAMQALQAGVAEAQVREKALRQAQRDEPVRFDRFGERIAELEVRLRALAPRVASLAQEQQAAVQELAVAELARQKERLAGYTTQARFAVAQLYDQATRAKDADHAAK